MHLHTYKVIECTLKSNALGGKNPQPNPSTHLIDTYGASVECQVWCFVLGIHACVQVKVRVLRDSTGLYLTHLSQGPLDVYAWTPSGSHGHRSLHTRCVQIPLNIQCVLAHAPLTELPSASLQVDEQLYRLQFERADLLKRIDEDQGDLNDLMQKHKDLIAQVRALSQRANSVDIAAQR